MSGGRKARGCEATREDWEAYIRANAVALVEARNEQIARLRAEVTRLARKCEGLTTGRDRLREAIVAFLCEWKRLYRNYDDRYIVCSLAAAVRDSLHAALAKEGIQT